MYDEDISDGVTVVLENGMQKDREYTAVINVTTAAGCTIKEVSFGESRKITTVGLLHVLIILHFRHESRNWSYWRNRTQRSSSR